MHGNFFSKAIMIVSASPRSISFERILTAILFSALIIKSVAKNFNLSEKGFSITVTSLKTLFAINTFSKSRSKDEACPILPEK